MTETKYRPALLGLAVAALLVPALVATGLPAAAATRTAAASAATATCNPGDQYTPCVSVQPTAAAPGQSVTVTGTGWAVYGQLGYDVPIMFGFTPQGDNVADPIPSTDGTFTVVVTVPADAPLGPTTVEGLNGNGTSPTTPFTVTPTPNCPSVLFLGAHGVNEGSRTSWGANIQAIWKAFHSQVPAAVGKPANYPYIKLDWPIDFSTPKQALALQGKAKSAAHALETQMYNQFTACGTSTRFVLAGYSLGAWVVDLALRDLNSTVAGQLVLAQVAGVGLMETRPSRNICARKSPANTAADRCAAREWPATGVRATRSNRTTWPTGFPGVPQFVPVLLRYLPQPSLRSIRPVQLD